ncbi:MAG: UbiD family decarboxylase, partial [candidate division Zixibacteria bacterium]|nr:UbiD family decarboxylase [candidate division Zixibacteria bacterium]
MPYNSLREFLDRLEREKQLVRMDKEVLPEPDISAAACAASKIQGGPAILFERIQGYEGKKVVMNIHGSWKNHALMLEMPKDTGIKEQFQELVKRWDDFPIPPKEVSKAPLKEIIINKNINLFNEIPLFRVNRYDGGYYLSKACVVSKDPENPKIQNVGIYRLQVKDKDRIGIQMGAHHDIAV